MNKTSVKILKAIINETYNVSTLREISGVKEWQFNEQTKKLFQDGYIKKEGSFIKLQDNAKAVLLQKISHTWNLENLLRDSNELVFSYLTESLTVNEIVANTGLSTATIYRAISDLGAIGTIRRERGGRRGGDASREHHGGKAAERISIDPTKTDLMNFAIILKTEREKLHEPDAEIIYKDKEKTVKKVAKGKITKGELTSFSAFPDYGIQYESPYDYYASQKDPLDIHDIVIHSVLTAYKTNDKLGLIMAVVFYVHNKSTIDTKRLREIAASFSITTVWLDVEAYIRRQKIKHKNLFLSWNEFVAKAELYEIDQKKYAVPTSAPSLFEDIGRHLITPMKIFLMGGENMRLKNLKAVTKDCDMIVERSSDFETLCKILTEQLGYERIIKIEYSQEDLRLYPDDILIHPNRSRIDLFTKRVLKDLSLSDMMIRTADYLEFGKLRVGVLRNEYVFLLKAVASREGDIQDMAKLSQGSLNQPREFEHGKFDWDEVWREAIHQEKINPLREITLPIFDQISLLVEQTGIIVPILEKLKRHVLEQLILRLIRGGKQPLKEIVFNLIGGDISEQMVRNRVDALVKDGTVRKLPVGRGVFVESVDIQHFPYKDWQATPANMETYLSWRFPQREQSTMPTIKRFVDDMTGLGLGSIGRLDSIIVNQMGRFLEYERQCSSEESHESVGVARACIGLSDPELGKNGASSFYILNYEQFVKTENEADSTPWE